MEHLPKKIHQNGISYTLVGDYYRENSGHILLT